MCGSCAASPTTRALFSRRSIAAGKLRAIAGGGRYDNLVGQLSDGAVSLPALGFAMGDVVLGELIRETRGSRQEMESSHRREATDRYLCRHRERGAPRRCARANPDAA